ncbi:MAG: glutathione S-transferase N-terminal domain-containing protein [Chromatiaceae bacterium]|nr:glutathione S-transferase N-terminal domain-containing protein [Gammaproteobacteria bacterium]MCP5447340.1 glutathione S-transferase N-terminal domain-containing protein [Chromatiaceae bacterium]MCB1861465.1 glutathione S-transferase N-terminal domain-containing protein [Gammaproteobacteria bacterium]MCB1873339.1 glutathione S-transferase N-terminal domain-containing protein [Gammaproteobacteria bacterium]MCB1878719.1 glutathione S-transferase N-terminal domain-containing protein [Gammaprote
MTVVANKRSVMTMYSDASSPYSHRVRLVLAEKNITVEVLDVDPLAISDDIMDLNPYGTLPTLVDRDLVLYESRIIMEYLDERFPHPPLMPVDPVSKASSRLFLHRVDHDWYRLMDQILAGGKQAGKARKELRESLTVTAPVFASKPFFMSTDFSLVDCSIGPLLWRLPLLGIELPTQAKAVNEYAKNLFGRESFRESLTELEVEMRE